MHVTIGAYIQQERGGFFHSVWVCSTHDKGCLVHQDVCSLQCGCSRENETTQTFGGPVHG